MVTDEMVEKAARRMAVADGQNPDKLSHNSFEWWRHYVPMARAALEAALSAAEPIEQDENPMRFFAENVDKWGALEWFNRMVDACEDHDRKRTQAFRCEDPGEKDILSLSADTSKMIMSSSAFHLAREHKEEIRAALSDEKPYDATQSLMIGSYVNDAAHNLLLKHTGSEGGCPTVNWYKLRDEIALAIEGGIDAFTVSTALSAQVQDVASSGGTEFPEALTDDLRDVLSTMLWTSGQIAACLRAGGDQIKRRAEDEQAHVLHWLISLALKHGPEWRAKASERIKAIRDAAAPAKQEGGE